MHIAIHTFGYGHSEMIYTFRYTILLRSRVICMQGDSSTERSVFYCQTTSAITAPCTYRRMCYPTHCTTHCAPCQPLLRPFSGWIRTPPPTTRVQEPPPTVVSSVHISGRQHLRRVMVQRGMSYLSEAHVCRGTSLKRKRTLLGPYSRPMPRVPGGS